MKKLETIFTLSVRSMLKLLGGVFVVGVIVLLCFTHNRYLSAKGKIEQHLKIALSYNHITPVEENEYLVSMSKITGQFGFNIVSKQTTENEGHSRICSRNNCYNLNYDKLKLKFYSPVLILIFISLVLYGIFVFMQRRINLVIKKQIDLFATIVNEGRFDKKQIETKELNDLVNILENKKKTEKNLFLIREIAHDMQVPIAALSAAIGSPHENNKILSEVLKRLVRLNDKILKYEFSEQFSVVDVKELIRNAISEMSMKYQNVHFVIDEENHPNYSVSIKKNDIYRAIVNLIKNSIEANKSNRPSVELRILAEKNNCIILICDNGPGFSEFIINNFGKKDIPSTKKDGHGIGLKQVRRSVLESNGEIDISNYKNGAQVKIILPIKNTVINNTSSSSLPVVFIDDDKLIQMSWKMAAEKAGREIVTYSSVDDFLTNAEQFSKDTLIYIDSDLGHGIRGEIESEKIFNLGFAEIRLATGFSPGDIDKPLWIKEIVGKRAPF